LGKHKTKIDFVLGTGGQLGIKLAGYATLMLLARHLTRADMGAYFYTVALATLAANACDFGTNTHTVRTAARHDHPSESLRLLSSVLGLRLALALVSFGAANLFVWLTRPELAELMALVSAFWFFASLYFSFAALITGKRRMVARVLTGSIGYVLMIGVALLAVQFQWTLERIVVGFMAVHALALLVAALYVAWRFGPFTIRLRWNETRTLLAVCLPLFLVAFLDLLHFKVDTVMLGLLESRTGRSQTEEVARYESAYKIFEASRFLARPMLQVFLPITAALAAQAAWGRLAIKIRRLWLMALGGALALALPVLLLADLIMPFMFGDAYADAAVVLRILFLATPALYLAFVANFICNALYLERLSVLAMLACLAINVGLNLTLIPRFGANGAAATTLATETLLAAALIAIVVIHLRRRRHDEPEQTPDPATAKKTDDESPTAMETHPCGSAVAAPARD